MIAGGVESMTRAPYVMPKADERYDRAAEDVRHDARLAHDQSEHAAGVHDLDGRDGRERRASNTAITREEQDAFALVAAEGASRRRARGVRRRDSCRLAASVAARRAPAAANDAADLAKLKPAFKKAAP